MDNMISSVSKCRYLRPWFVRVISHAFCAIDIVHVLQGLDNGDFNGHHTLWVLLLMLHHRILRTVRIIGYSCWSFCD